MSQHLLPALPKYAGATIRIGWDRPLNTYFASVVDHREDAPEDAPFLWIGQQPGEILNPARVIKAVAPYAVIPDGLAAALLADSQQPAGPVSPRPARR